MAMNKPNFSNTEDFTLYENQEHTPRTINPPNASFKEVFHQRRRLVEVWKQEGRPIPAERMYIYNLIWDELSAVAEFVRLEEIRICTAESVELEEDTELKAKIARLVDAVGKGGSDMKTELKELKKRQGNLEARKKFYLTKILALRILDQKLHAQARLVSSLPSTDNPSKILEIIDFRSISMTNILTIQLALGLPQMDILEDRRIFSKPAADFNEEPDGFSSMADPFMGAGSPSAESLNAFMRQHQPKSETALSLWLDSGYEDIHNSNTPNGSPHEEPVHDSYLPKKEEMEDMSDKNWLATVELFSGQEGSRNMS
jgi:hypothetical protein